MTDPAAGRPVLVTGGAGFVGSNLVDDLVRDGLEVVVYDNFSTGQQRFLEQAEGSGLVRVVEGDVLDGDALAEAMDGCGLVFHLAANADVRHGLEDPERDLRQNTLGTFSVLETMRLTGVRRILFASSGSVYGEPEVFPTPEACPFPRQTSFYGASKLAGEALLQAYCEGYGFAGTTCRFVSVLGERYSHGHLFDFYRNLKHDPSQLLVLGDGRQRKSYFYVGDCVAALRLLAARTVEPGSQAFNLGTDEVTDVVTSVDAVSRHLGVSPEVRFAGGERGWVGDSPLIHLDCSRLRALGWRPTLTIAEAVDRTLRWFDANAWIFRARVAA